jgi:hypothetical protein
MGIPLEASLKTLKSPIPRNYEQTEINDTRPPTTKQIGCLKYDSHSTYLGTGNGGSGMTLYQPWLNTLGYITLSSNVEP